MQGEGREESEEMSSPDMRESMPHGDVAQILTQAYNSTKSAVMGCLPHYLMLGE